MFRDRLDAGAELADELLRIRLDRPVVLALPRGGVPVAAVVARALGAPLDLVVVRKLGSPDQPEYAMGAIAEGGVRVLDASTIRLLAVSDADIAAVESAERAELARRVERYRRGRPPLDLTGREAVVVDDGLATGATARAACLSARARGAARVVLAVPCAPADVADRVPEADEVVCPVRAAAFFAVGQFYACFDQVDDADVLRALDEAGPSAASEWREAMSEQRREEPDPWEVDPTLMRNQASLTTSEGTVWVAAAAVTSVLVVGMLIALWWRLDAPLALLGALATAVLMLAMIIVRYAVRSRRSRLVTLAALFWLMVLADLAIVLVVAIGP
ncbi:hypothetical protein GCM10009792_11910 [Microcella alkalica]|uniref:Putative phosphoribosyltransferase n=1 Tax=Microcella alkalica TaxID=355930 RepID=A0A839EBY3_9MICO|nr:putative phosphoribosyltransferase [Microcella alkalica]